MNRRTLLRLGTTASAAVVLPAPRTQASFQEKSFRVAVIGHTGRGNYGHGLDTMWTKIPDCEVVAVADADAAGLKGALHRLPNAKPFSDYHRLLSEVRPDVVAVAPRHVDQHHEMLIAAIKSGARGIYVEKPFVRTPAEADEVRKLSQESGTCIAVAHRNRWHPVLPKVRELLDEGIIGRLLEARGRGKEDTRGGSQDLWVLGTHVINLASVFLGSFQSVSAEILQNGNRAKTNDLPDGPEGLGPLPGDELHARFTSVKGVPFFFDSIKSARLKSAAVSHPASFGLQLIGTTGIIDFRIDREPLAALLPGSPFDPDFSNPRQWIPISTGGPGIPETHPHAGSPLASHEVSGKDLLDSIRENRQPLCDVVQGCETVEAVCGVFESHRQGGREVRLPLAERTHPLRRK